MKERRLESGVDDHFNMVQRMKPERISQASRQTLLGLHRMGRSSKLGGYQIYVGLMEPSRAPKPDGSDFQTWAIVRSMSF